MCAIFAILSKDSGQLQLRQVQCHGKGACQTAREFAYELSGRQRHRGPDYTGVHGPAQEGVIMVHERLAILGVRHGNQPFVSADEQLLLVANGELYNYLAVADRISERRDQIYRPRSDCDVIMGLYEVYGLNLIEHIRGMFAFVLFDRQRKSFVAARDPIGIIPLYLGWDADGNLYFSSEMKCLVGVCTQVDVFEPGVLMHGQPSLITRERFFSPPWLTEVPQSPYVRELLRDGLVQAVRSHLQCDVPFGALLSGGLDSSLIASIATKLKREKDPAFRLRTYSVGLKNAPDLAYAKKVAEFIGSDHEEVNFTVAEGLDCIRSIIYHTESYDVTTIRASIPMYILSRRVKSEGIKMVLSGEGADEIFGGYLYFHSAPSSDEFHRETVARVRGLHYSDCLRANKSTMSWGVELRVPFLDTDFLNHAMSIRPLDRMPLAGTQLPRRCIEKFILRDAFSEGFLPEEVLWRQKEQFSDGVGYLWIDQIKEYAASHVSDLDFMAAPKLFPHNTPNTKEAFFYRSLFAELFPGETFAKTVARWIPRTDWGCSADPSGRAQAVHLAATPGE